jgi:hypothetical protein
MDSYSTDDEDPDLKAFKKRKTTTSPLPEQPPKEEFGLIFTMPPIAAVHDIMKLLIPTIPEKNLTQVGPCSFGTWASAIHITSPCQDTMNQVHAILQENPLFGEHFISYVPSTEQLPLIHYREIHDHVEMMAQSEIISYVKNKCDPSNRSRLTNLIRTSSTPEEVMESFLQLNLGKPMHS